MAHPLENGMAERFRHAANLRESAVGWGMAQQAIERIKDDKRFRPMIRYCQ